MNEIFVQVINRAIERPTNDDNDTSIDDIVLPENYNGVGTLGIHEYVRQAWNHSLLKRFAALGGVEPALIGDDLTFNWIRCDTTAGENSSNSLLDQVWGRPYLNRTQLKPDVQEAGAISRWRLNAAELYNETFDNLVNINKYSTCQYSSLRIRSPKCKWL